MSASICQQESRDDELIIQLIGSLSWSSFFSRLDSFDGLEQMCAKIDSASGAAYFCEERLMSGREIRGSQFGGRRT